MVMERLRGWRGTQGIWGSLILLKAVIKRLTDKEVSDLDLVEALLAEAGDESRFNRLLNIGRRRLVVTRDCLLNEATANRVARWALRALGPDFRLRNVHGLYRVLVEEQGARPWSLDTFSHWAFGYSRKREAARLRTAREAREDAP